MPQFIVWTVMVSIVLIPFAVWGLFGYWARYSQLTSQGRRRFVVASGAYLAGWLGLAFVLGSSGFFQSSPSKALPATLLGIVLPLLAGAILLYRSSVLQTVLAMVPLPWLVGIQFYRIVGLIFLVLYALGRMPAEFAIPAGVGDLLIGLAAPVIAYVLYKGSRWSCLAVAAWNMTGIVDLLIAVSTGFLSSPGPFQALALENPNLLISAFPLVLVPVVVVPMSILLHLVALKRLKAALGTRKGFEAEGQPCWTPHPSPG